MNILYCGDAGIARGVLVSILSLLMNGERHELDAEKHNQRLDNHNHDTRKRKKLINRGEKNHNTGLPKYNIYIATIKYRNVKAFPEKVAKFLDELVKKYNPESSVTLIDATKAFVAKLPKKNMNSYFTPCSMLRLYIDKIPELARLDRILYLDYDVVCRREIMDFYWTDLGDVEAAGVLDIYGKHFYRYHGWFKRKRDRREMEELPKDEISRWVLKQDYMNSGVMLFNVSKCLETGMFGRAVDLCAKRKMMLADQAALNKTIAFRKLMPRRYNEQAERPKPDTVLHHFSNNFKFWPYFRVQKVKPFEVDKIHKILKIHEYDDILTRYEELVRELPKVNEL